MNNRFQTRSWRYSFLRYFVFFQGFAMSSYNVHLTFNENIWQLNSEIQQFEILRSDIQLNKCSDHTYHLSENVNLHRSIYEKCSNIFSWEEFLELIWKWQYYLLIDSNHANICRTKHVHFTILILRLLFLHQIFKFLLLRRN